MRRETGVVTMTMDDTTSPNLNSKPQPTVESVESNPQSDASAIVTEPDWEDVGARVLSELSGAVEIIRTAECETVHDWDGVDTEWGANARPDATSVCLKHSSGAWVRIEDSSVSAGYNVLVCDGPDAIPQRSFWSTRGQSLLLQKCETHATAKMLKYIRDGEFGMSDSR